MSARMFMLAFVFSRMLNPLSFTVFIIMYCTFYVCASSMIPNVHWTAGSHLVNNTYVPLLFVRFLLFVTAITMLLWLCIQIIGFGKVVIKRATFSLVLALCVLHLTLVFSVHSFSLSLSNQQSNHALNKLLTETPLEFATMLILGILLALYCGVLEREKFKKDIGFVEDY